MNRRRFLAWLGLAPVALPGIAGAIADRAALGLDVRRLVVEEPGFHARSFELPSLAEMRRSFCEFAAEVDFLPPWEAGAAA